VEGDDGGGGIAEAPTDTDVLHYFLDIEINPGAEWIGGSNTMNVRSLVDGLTTFSVRLRSNFDITEMSIDGTPLSWTRPDLYHVEATLDRAYNAGEEFELFVAYDGQVVSAGFGSINFTTQSGQPLVCTLSETNYAYTWWPTKDDNRDKATADLWFTVPAGLVVVSNGSLQHPPGTPDDVGGGRVRYRWKTDYPTATYLYAFSATDYHRYEQTWNYGATSMATVIYVYPADDTANNRNAWFKSLDMLTVFSDRYGLYPFADEKYAIYEFAFGGGMEHQTATGQGTFSESVTAHELGHQWWGDMVTCATWSDIWLNEGFATYSEAIWFENRPGSAGEADLHAHMANRRPSSVDGTVYIDGVAWNDMNRIFSTSYSYRKGGWVLHMLRHVVGDDAFFQILADYRQAYAYSSADSFQFIDVVESVAGADMDWFFGPWLFDIGAPAYAYGWRPVTAGGQNYIELYLRQTQDPSYPLFTMPVDVVTNGAATHVVWNDAEAEHFLFPVSGSVTSVAVDPEHWILTVPESATTTSFVEGPPKIVSIEPAPGSAVPAGLATVEVVFHKAVTATAGDFAVTGDTVGSVPFSFSYDSGTRTATLSISPGLPDDDYTLTVAASVVDQAAGKALDGEIADPADPASLPSGEGLPGGAASVRFSVGFPAGDLNCDFLVNNADIPAFVLAITATPPLYPEYYDAYPGCDRLAGDVNGDGSLNNADIPGFVDLLTQ